MSPLATPTPAGQGGWMHTAKVVLMSFVGLRKSNEHEIDAQKINPLHLVVVGIVCAVIFVVGLMLFAQWMVAAAN